MEGGGRVACKKLREVGMTALLDYGKFLVRAVRCPAYRMHLLQFLGGLLRVSKGEIESA